jgi:hypothetical protein
MIIFIWVLTSCAVFKSSPRLAHIQIKGPNNYTKEYVFSLDHLESAESAGIRLTDRYAIEVDLQWLWYEFEDLDFLNTRDGAQTAATPLAPWFMCKYKF